MHNQQKTAIVLTAMEYFHVPLRAGCFSDNRWVQLVQEGSGKRVGELSSDTLVPFQ